MSFKTYDPLGLLSPGLQRKWDTIAQDLKEGISTTLPSHRLTSFVLHTLKPIYPALRVKLWSDSEIVLHWPHSNKPLIPFMTNRTEEIKNLFPASDWNHCLMSVNPADLLTRGINTHRYMNHLYGNVGRSVYNWNHIGLLGLRHKPFTLKSLKQLFLTPSRNSLRTIRSLNWSSMALMVNNSILMSAVH